MDINWLQDFVCLARTLSFTRAADERFVTQSAFSRRIKALETWLGTPLVNRGSYPTRLSAAGEEFLPVARRIVSEILQVRDELRGRERDGAGQYGFASPHTISITRLAPLLSRLSAHAPEVRTRVMSDNLHACCEFLSTGACEFLICYRHPRIPLNLDESRYTRIDLGTERLLPVCVPNASGSAPAWSLPGDGGEPMPLLGYTRGSFLGAVVEHVLESHRMTLRRRHTDAFAEALKSLALEGAGIAWLPERAIASALATARLVPAGGSDWEAEMTLSMFTEPARLDAGGLKVWSFFAAMAG